MSDDKIEIENVNRPGRIPQGATAGWWLKAVQFDLEAKGIIKRAINPVHLHKALATTLEGQPGDN